LKSCPKTLYVSAIQNTRISIQYYEVMGEDSGEPKTPFAETIGEAGLRIGIEGANNSVPVARKSPHSKPLLMIHVPRLSGLISSKPGSRAALQGVGRQSF
jgi:hypothetical protein